MEGMHEFIWSDVWILVSMLCYVKSEEEITKPIQLRDIIASADWINHAIVTRGELDSGLYKLINAGFIKKNNGQYHLTALTLPFYKKFQQKKGMARIIEEIKKSLKVVKQSVTLEKLENSDFNVVSTEEFIKDFQEYKEMWKKLK